MTEQEAAMQAFADLFWDGAMPEAWLADAPDALGDSARLNDPGYDVDEEGHDRT